MTDDALLAGKHVIVTGASMGIGEITARACLAAGARVTICARNADGITAAVGRLARDDTRDAIAGTTADVSSQASVEALFAASQRRFGPIDAVVHAAGVLDATGPIADVDPAAWLRVVEIDLFGAFLVAREACRCMRGRGGRIVLFSGGGASGPFPGFSAYACSKVAVVRLVENAAIEMHADGIEINALAPGMVATRMLARVAQETGGLTMPPVEPELAARAAVFLVSDRARGITGKLVSAVHDDYAQWPAHAEELAGGDLFTLRRVVPKERGMTWQ